MQKAVWLREPAWAAFHWKVTYVPISLSGKLVQWDLVHLTIVRFFLIVQWLSHDLFLLTYSTVCRVNF